MADLAAGDVSVAILDQRVGASSRKNFNVALTFGDGALTYPAGGIPLAKAKLGCPTVIESLSAYDVGTSGFVAKYDRANEKLILFRSGAGAGSHTHDILLKDAAVADGATTRVNAGANLLGANTGGDLTVTGGGANGGVVAANAAVAAAALAEPTGFALAAMTVRAEVIGW